MLGDRGKDLGLRSETWHTYTAPKGVTVQTAPQTMGMVGSAFVPQVFWRADRRGRGLLEEGR